ncbi:ribonuclease H-like domain-containing protein [Favolaschia claudopus]|uniref:3'-5' exonuclease n=1 Tax=Favolaschia claudopus TaxID=2862362 RepID=A0AAW0B634_9AGAR
MQNTHQLFDLAASTVVNLGNAPNVVLPSYELKLALIKVEDVATADAVLLDIRSGDVIGFDTEYRHFKGPHGLTLCVVQIATERNVFVLDMTQIQRKFAFIYTRSTILTPTAECPAQLHRILVDPTIAKCGVGVEADAKVIWTDFGIEMLKMVDLGRGPVSLQQCVADMLHHDMSKDDRRTKWELGLKGTSEATQRLVHYAALDAQAGREIYFILAEAIQVTGVQRQTVIPDDWYSYNYSAGMTTRLERNLDGMHEKWSFTVCRWYKGNIITNFWP